MYVCCRMFICLCYFKFFVKLLKSWCGSFRSDFFFSWFVFVYFYWFVYRICYLFYFDVVPFNWIIVYSVFDKNWILLYVFWMNFWKFFCICVMYYSVPHWYFVYFFAIDFFHCCFAGCIFFSISSCIWDCIFFGCFISVRLRDNLIVLSYWYLLD